ncbi:DUF5050 domain-containing protein [Jeotgalibaca sp. A122]|uniref:DUF5050 domain-containing protein n=1 Tax=Jeotgalibaca sp. A122 TaxID=3457322 RepID=UPI003FD275C3
MKKIMSVIFICFFSLTFTIGCTADNPKNPPPLNTYGNTSGNLNNGGVVAQQGDWIYYTHLANYGLYKMKTDGSEKMKLNDDSPYNMNVVGDWIYYFNFPEVAESEPPSSYKIKTDGTERTRMEYGVFFGSVVVGDWIYSAIEEEDGFKLYKIKTDGTEKIKLDGEGSVYSIYVVGDWIYYGSTQIEEGEMANPGDIYKIKTDGTERTKVSEGNHISIVVVDDWIYYVAYSVDETVMYKIKTDGTEQTQIVDDNDIGGLNVVGSWIYFTRKTEPGIFKIKTDGTGKTKLNEDAIFASGIADGWIYYLTYKSDGEAIMYKIKTDGTERTEVK